MNLTAKDLIRLMELIRHVIDSGLDANDFVRNTFYAFQPFFNLHSTLMHCEPTSTVTIPFALAMDINSIVLAHQSSIKAVV
ncbi:hypothetical protein ADLP2_023 [Acinetobacter phage vB_AbaM_DLP2]|nr:hypothetical protein ADLP2_023 [Acinetobacter phage vB_AbaM_DLP2]